MEKLLPRIKEFLNSRNGQILINIIVFLGIGNWVLQWTRDRYLNNQLDFVEMAFAIHNVILLTLVLIRTRHKAVDRSLFNQGIALIAFFSGLAFEEKVTKNLALLFTSKLVIFISIILGAITLINLGRSFGILIAARDIKTGGLYGIVRHPMYFTDILWKTGMIMKIPTRYNAGIFTISVCCYVYRAILEEQFLSREGAYREYMQRVRYRFLPGIF